MLHVTWPSPTGGGAPPHPRAYKRRTSHSRVLSERERGPGCDAQQQLDGKTDSIIISQLLNPEQTSLKG